LVKLADRQPTLNCLRYIPIAAKPPHVVVLVEQDSDAAAYHQSEKDFFPLLEKCEDDSPHLGQMILVQFPSEARFHMWYAHPDYQELSEHRRAARRLEFLTMVRGSSPVRLT
jgi:hypothetical protein